MVPELGYRSTAKGGGDGGAGDDGARVGVSIDDQR